VPDDLVESDDQKTGPKVTNTASDPSPRSHLQPIRSQQARVCNASHYFPPPKFSFVWLSSAWTETIATRSWNGVWTRWD